MWLPTKLQSWSSAWTLSITRRSHGCMGNLVAAYDEVVLRFAENDRTRHQPTSVTQLQITLPPGTRSPTRRHVGNSPTHPSSRYR
jgi:hypothetical protein